MHDRMDNDLTNPKRVQDVASDSKCPVKLSLSVSFRRMPLRSPHGFESGTRRGGRVIGLLAPLIPEYYQWFSTDPPRYRSPVLISPNSFLLFFFFKQAISGFLIYLFKFLEISIIFERAKSIVLLVLGFWNFFFLVIIFPCFLFKEDFLRILLNSSETVRVYFFCFFIFQFLSIEV